MLNLFSSCFDDQILDSQARYRFVKGEITMDPDWAAEGSEAFQRDAASPYGEAPPEEVEGLLWNHYEWNLSRVESDRDRERAWGLLVEGYEAARNSV